MSWGRAADLAPSCHIEGGEAVHDGLDGEHAVGWPELAIGGALRAVHEKS
jgi:hypothetical protein